MLFCSLYISNVQRWFATSFLLCVLSLSPFVVNMSFVIPYLQNPHNPNKIVPSSIGLPAPPSSSLNFNGSSINAPPFGSIPYQDRGSDTYGSGYVSNFSIKCTIFQDLANRQQHATVVDGITFIKAVDPTKDPKTIEFPMLGISRLNHLLKYDPDMRANYGAKRDAAQLKHDWRMFGLQVGETQGEYESSGGKVQKGQTFVIAGRCRFYSLWSSLDRSGSQRTGVLQPLDRLFLVCRRYKYVGALEDEFGTKVKAVTDPSVFKQLKDGTIYQHSKKRKRNDDDDETKEDATVKKQMEEANQYYWQWDCYVSRNGKPPSAAVWSSNGVRNPNNFEEFIEQPWTGTYIYVAKVWDGYSNLHQTNRIMYAARNALYPKGNDDKYKREMALLPQAEVFLHSW